MVSFVFSQRLRSTVRLKGLHILHEALKAFNLGPNFYDHLYRDTKKLL